MDLLEYETKTMVVSKLGKYFQEVNEQLLFYCHIWVWHTANTIMKTQKKGSQRYTQPSYKSITLLVGQKKSKATEDLCAIWQN